MDERRRTVSILLVMALVISVMTNTFIVGPFVMIGSSNDMTNEEDWNTTLNVTVLQMNLGLIRMISSIIILVHGCLV